MWNTSFFLYIRSNSSSGFIAGTLLSIKSLILRVTIKSTFIICINQYFHIFLQSFLRGYPFRYNLFLEFQLKNQSRKKYLCL